MFIWCSHSTCRVQIAKHISKWWCWYVSIWQASWELACDNQSSKLKQLGHYFNNGNNSVQNLFPLWWIYLQEKVNAHQNAHDANEKIFFYHGYWYVYLGWCWFICLCVRWQREGLFILRLRKTVSLLFGKVFFCFCFASPCEKRLLTVIKGKLEYSSFLFPPKFEYLVAFGRMAVILQLAKQVKYKKQLSFTTFSSYDAQHGKKWWTFKTCENL